ncbi:MAG TPA: DUF2207 domain-containing protein [Gemmatimonadales bacterium]|nr:DUF2207 domain-containing protein [Gemmatimonadales bacterium]
MRRPLAGAIALALLASTPLWAQRSYTIERFDAGIVVNRDASIDVTETITVNFVGAWNGVYRSIPVDYRSPQGFNWTLRLELVSATDGSGNVLRTEASRERHYLKYKMWIPGAEDATRVVILKYRAKNGLRFFEDHDELYWNVTGDEWDVPLGAVSARIELPAGATGLRATSFTGSYGATTQDAAVDTTGNVVRITMNRPLAYREGVTAVVGWDKGVVRAPGTAERFFAGLADNWALLIPLPVFFGMLSLWRRRGRDPDELPVQVRYEPPEGLTPAEVGTLVDERPDMRDLTASVVDLAVKGYLRIEEQEEKKLLGLVTDREYVFHRVRDRSAWGELADHERRLMHGLFEGDARTAKLADLRNEFYRHLPAIKDAIFDRLIAHGLYASRPDKVRSRWLAFAAVLGVAPIPIGIVLAAKFGVMPLPFFIGGLVSAAIVAFFGWHMPARTLKGARTAEQVKGFGEFLERVEKDRFERVVKTPEMFERFLPFAMALQVEERWARAFEGIYTEPPTWYVGNYHGTFNAARFSSSLGDLSSAAGTTMSSMPRSSGGSGFSGGFSGGGFGGGGGGAF